MTLLIDKIRESIIGDKRPMMTPFGRKPLVYADYTASGRSLGFIEAYIQDHVLPFYANTHTESSFTGAQTTRLREQARQQIREAVNGNSQDKVIFCGPGATAAINKLIDILNLRLPRDLDDRHGLSTSIPPEQRPVVFIGPYEHHSNELPWRESIAEVVVISLTDKGHINSAELERQLKAYADRPLLIGSFSAASNVTGIKSDVEGVTSLLKQHNALAFWDYAAAAPYVGIDVNACAPIDAVFMSPHKFIGGPGTPGVLVAKKSLFNNTVPALVGGGTVVYVTPENHVFIEDEERREEGGTPAIVESIRAGLVFKLQQEVGTREIERLEHDFITRAMERLADCDNLEILGSVEADRLSILSLRFKHGDKDLHYGFVVALLNDLFGIQVRGGCSCAGPYGHSLLGIDMASSRALESEIKQGATVLRPGWVRLNFNYFIHNEEFEYLIQAIELVAQQGWRLLPYYRFDAGNGCWKFQNYVASLPVDLDTFSFCGQQKPKEPNKVALEGMLQLAREELLLERPPGAPALLELSPEGERLRWFVLPEEVSLELSLSAYPHCASL